MKLRFNQIKSLGVSLAFFDEIGLKSHKIARGKPRILNEIGLKSDKLTKGTS